MELYNTNNPMIRDYLLSLSITPDECSLEGTEWGYWDLPNDLIIEMETHLSPKS